MTYQELTASCLLWTTDPATLAAFRKMECVVTLESALSDAKKGYETPSPWQNGCKTKTALIRKRKAELDDCLAKPDTAFLDVWQEAVDAKYARKPFAVALVNSQSDKSQGECRSMRQQTIDLLTDAGFTLDYQAGVYAPPSIS